MRTVAGEIRAKRSNCRSCVDQCFAGQVVDKIDRSPRNAFSLLVNSLSTLRLASIIVEKAHLIGQDIRKPKSRGLAPVPLQLSMRTYHGYAILSGRRTSAAHLKRVLAQRNMTRKVFSSYMQRFHVHNGAKRLQAKKILQTKVAKKRKTSAWNIFQKESRIARAKIGTPAHKLEQLRLQTRWADMSDAEKMQSSGSTQERNTARRECSNESCYRAAKRWAGILPASTMKNVGSDMAVDIAGQLSGVVPYGLGLGTVSSALALEHMKLRTAVHAKGENSLHFLALEEEVKNPPGTMKPVRPCCVACFGLCRKVSTLHRAKVFTNYMRSMLRSKHIDRDRLPVVLALRVEVGIPVSKLFAITDDIGNGELQLLVHLKLEVERFKLDLCTDRGRMGPVVKYPMQRNM